MLERKVILCPIEQRADNAERIRKIISDDMRNGNYLRGLAMSFNKRFVPDFDGRDEIYADFLLRMSGKSPETYKYIVNDSEPVANNREFVRWVVRCFDNLMTDYLRKRRRGKEFSLARLGYDDWKEIGGIILSDYPFCDYSPEQKIIKEETEKLLTESILNFTEKEQRIIDMYCFKRRKYREIADELNIPLGTVKNVLNQTREKLKRKIIN